MPELYSADTSARQGSACRARYCADQGKVNATGAGSPAVASTSWVLVVPADVTAIVKRPDAAVVSLLNPSALPAENVARTAAAEGTV